MGGDIFSSQGYFAKETQRHEELRTSDRCDEYDERKYARLAEGNVTEVETLKCIGGSFGNAS